MKMSHIEEGRLHAYLDGECAAREMEQIEAHLEICDECQDRLATATAATHAASDLLAEVEPAPMSAPSWRELEERAAARTRKETRRVWARPSLAWAAVIAVAFGLGWFSKTYWSSASQAPVSEYRQPQTRVFTADALERAQPSQTASGAQTDAGIGQQAGESRVSEASAPEDRELKTANELPTPPTEPGRRAAAKAETEETDREGAVNAERAPSSRSEDLARAATDEVAPRLAEPEPAVAGVQARRQPTARQELQEARPDQALAYADTSGVFAQRTLQLRDAADEAAAGFLSVQPGEAAAWLNGELRMLPDLELMRIEVGPGSSVTGAWPGLPAVRLSYEDAAGHPIVLIQQRIGDRSPEANPSQPVLTVDPSGRASYRWIDDRGYQLILVGRISSDSLRALAERVR
jgi:hypothetical protein